MQMAKSQTRSLSLPQGSRTIIDLTPSAGASVDYVVNVISVPVVSMVPLKVTLSSLASLPARTIFEPPTVTLRRWLSRQSDTRLESPTRRPRESEFILIVIVNGEISALFDMKVPDHVPFMSGVVCCDHVKVRMRKRPQIPRRFVMALRSSFSDLCHNPRCLHLNRESDMGELPKLPAVRDQSDKCSLTTKANRSLPYFLILPGGHPLTNSGQREIADRPPFPLLLSPLTVSDAPNTF